MSELSAITLESVSRFEKGVTSPLLKSIKADLKKGQLIAVDGADGAGKTTLMRVMAGFLKPQEGAVKLFGEKLYSKELSRLHTLCGYMPQQFGLYTDINVKENLTLYAALFGLSEVERKKRFTELLSITGLTDFTARPAGKLSGGMKQKLGLACALLNHPKILLLDEPSVGVDPLSRRELWSILKKNVRTEAMTVVVATTYMDEAALCDDVLILENGEIILHDSPQAIAALATGLAFNVKVPSGTRVRDLQAQLLDDTDYILDAVPRSGYVRAPLRDYADREPLQEKYGLQFEPVAGGLEEGYLVNRAKTVPRHQYSVIEQSYAQLPNSSNESVVIA